MRGEARQGDVAVIIREQISEFAERGVAPV